MAGGRHIRTFLRVALSFAAIALVLTLAPLDEIVGHLQGTALPWLAAALLLQLLLRAVTAARMQLLAHFQKLGLNFWVMLRIVLATAFYGLFLPGGIAGGAVTFLKYRHFGAGGAAALTTVVVNKLIAALTIALLTCTAWLADTTHVAIGSDDLREALTLPLAFLLLMPFLIRIGTSVFGFAPTIQQRLAARSGRYASATAALLSQLQLLNQLGWWPIFSLVLAACSAHLIAATSMWCFGLALGLPMSFASVMWIYGVIFLLAMLPISFANVGVREASMIVLLSPYGISAAEATAWSVLLYLGPIATAMAGGLLETAAFGRAPALPGPEK